MFAQVPQAPLVLGPAELVLPALATLIIFAILGPRLWRELRARPADS